MMIGKTKNNHYSLSLQETIIKVDSSPSPLSAPYETVAMPDPIDVESRLAISLDYAMFPFWATIPSAVRSSRSTLCLCLSF